MSETRAVFVELREKVRLFVQAMSVPHGLDIYCAKMLTLVAIQSIRRPLKTTFDMTSSVFSTGGVPLVPFLFLLKGSLFRG